MKPFGSATKNDEEVICEICGKVYREEEIVAFSLEETPMNICKECVAVCRCGRWKER